MKIPKVLEPMIDAMRAHPKGLPLVKGQLVPDPTPIAPPIGYKREQPLFEKIRDMVRSAQLQEDLNKAGYETFEEADDFEVGDWDPRSPYEEFFEPTPVNELRRRQAEAESLASSPPGSVEAEGAGGAAAPKKAVPEPPLGSPEPVKT